MMQSPPLDDKWERTVTHAIHDRSGQARGKKAKAALDWKRALARAILAVLAGMMAVTAPAEALADGVSAVAAGRIAACVAGDPLEAGVCLEELVEECAATSAAQVCDNTIGLAAFEATLAAHPAGAAEAAAMDRFMAGECAAAADRSSFGPERSAAHALCIRMGRFKLIELILLPKAF